MKTAAFLLVILVGAFAIMIIGVLVHFTRLIIKSEKEQWKEIHQQR
jgi:hypothetical protein